MVLFKPHSFERITLISLQGIEGKYILARALTERYAPKEFMLDQSLGMYIYIL